MPTIAITKTDHTITIMGISVNNGNIPDNRCSACFLRTYQGLFERFDIPRNKREVFMQHFTSILEQFKSATSPEIQRELHRAFIAITGEADPFAREKAHSNETALSLYADWKEKVKTTDNPFDLALRLSIAGNIMDYGANSSFDIHATINRVINAQFAIDHSEQLKTRLARAKSILYLGDNAGEIVFDKLFIETIAHPDLTYVVRGGVALNDITLVDAEKVGISSIARVIDNGFDAPSTVLQRCSTEFTETFRNADLIIAKGQGNLEGLIGTNDPRIFFLLMVKCDVMAELLGVTKGSFIVKNGLSVTT